MVSVVAEEVADVVAKEDGEVKAAMTRDGAAMAADGTTTPEDGEVMAATVVDMAAVTEVEPQHGEAAAERWACRVADRWAVPEDTEEVAAVG